MDHIHLFVEEVVDHIHAPWRRSWTIVTFLGNIGGVHHGTTKPKTTPPVCTFF